jgi:hypothetical protein
MGAGAGGPSGASGGAATQQQGQQAQQGQYQTPQGYGQEGGVYQNPQPPQSGQGAYSYMQPAAQMYATMPQVANQQVGVQAPELMAMQQYDWLTGGPVGSSAATQAAMQGYQAWQQPEIQNNLATMGLGRSGAGANILARAQTQALQPTINQEIQNRMQAAQGYQGIGQQLASREQQTIQNQMAGLQQGAAGLAGVGTQVGALENQGISQALAAQQLEQQRQQNLITQGAAQGLQQQQVAQQALNAPYEDMVRRAGLAMQFLMPGGSLPQTGESKSTTQQGGGK